MKVSQFYDLVSALVYAFDTGRTKRVESIVTQLRDEIHRLERRKERNYKLPWFFN